MVLEKIWRMDRSLKKIVDTINENETIFNKTGKLYSSMLYADKVAEEQGRASFAIITTGDRQLAFLSSCGDYVYQSNCTLYAYFRKLDAPDKALSRLIKYISSSGMANVTSFSNDAGEIYKEIRKSDLKTELCMLKIEFTFQEYLPNYYCTACIGESCNNCNCGEK